MTEHTRGVEVHGELPGYLQGLEFPASVPEVLQHAEERGAPPAILEFLESLPAAVFTTEAGVRHALTGIEENEAPPSDAGHVLVGQDGTSS